jgi:hypothetical protein
MHRTCQIQRTFSVVILACCPIFLKVYRSDAVILTGITNNQEASYTVSNYSIYDTKTGIDRTGTLEGKIVIPKLQALPLGGAEWYQGLFEQSFPNLDILDARPVNGTQSLKLLPYVIYLEVLLRQTISVIMTLHFL